MSLFSSLAPPKPEQARRLADEMPTLAGQPLQAPQFFKTDWHFGESFTADDDPDRTREPWEPPAFVLEEDPASRLSATTAEDLEVRRFDGTTFARVVLNALSEEQCAMLLASVNGKGFTPALLNIGGGRQTLMPEVRDGHRVIVDSPQVATWLMEILRPHLPEKLGDGSRLVELNERLRFLLYTPGQCFEEHFDGMYVRPDSHQRSGDRSIVTVQLYLHDVPKHCGGATNFFPGRSEEVGHQPLAGSVLLFTQDLPHEGALVTKGIKYALRTEVMYTRDDNAALPPRWVKSTWRSTDVEKEPDC